MDINIKQLTTMLDMQDTMNKTINPNWVNLGWDYMRASCLEGAEAVEHHGWKWWKHQVRDDAQLQMEIIDIWHFYLSHILQAKKGNHTQALEEVNDYLKQTPEVIFDGKNYTLTNMQLLEKLDLLIGLAAAKRIDINLIFSLCEDCGLNWEGLFVQYVKKNMLNIFRQKHGYKEGTYHKEWFGEEDNVYLVSEANKLDSKADSYAQELWDALENTYAKALTAKA